MNDQLLRPLRCCSVARALHVSHLPLSFCHSTLAAFHFFRLQVLTLAVVDGSLVLCACAETASAATTSAAPMATRIRDMIWCSLLLADDGKARPRPPAS